MKAIKTTVFISICCILLTMSCKKGLDYLAHNYDQPNAECITTHAEEVDGLDGYSFDVTYNTNGDPATLTSYGQVSVMEYDNKNRLIKYSFDNGAHLDYNYKDKTFLPAIVHYYNPDYGGLLAIDSFKYNYKGEMIKRIVVNAQDPSYNQSSVYEYDNHRNVKKVITMADNGGTNIPAPYVEFEVTKYDNQYNFMSGNQWMKYILLYSNYQNYLFMMFSANNALDWTIGEPSGLYPVHITSDVKYNQQGFINKQTLHITDDEGTDYTDFIPVRLATSTCDVEKISNRKRNIMRHSNSGSSTLQKRMKEKSSKIPSPFSR